MGKSVAASGLSLVMLIGDFKPWCNAVIFCKTFAAKH